MLHIGRWKATAILATAMLGSKHPQFREAVRHYRDKQTKTVLAHPDPRT